MAESPKLYTPLHISHTQPSMALLVSAGVKAQLNQVLYSKFALAVHFNGVAACC